MIRATTPKHIFVFENDPSDFSRILITYAQGNRIVLEKEKDDLTIEDQGDGCWHLWFRLSQEETRMFQAGGGNILVQVRALTGAGEALASEKKRISLQDVLNDEVLV